MKYFLEIGAWQGEHLSRTADLERNGWTGVCVDPFPSKFENRNCQVCEKAISADGQDREFIKVSIDRRHGGDVSYFSGFYDSVNFHWDTIKKHCEFEVLMIKTITIDELFKTYNLPDHINFLSLDTEGSELEILNSIDFNKYSFGEIVVEHNGNKYRKNQIAKRLEPNGYRLKESQLLDDIYIQ